MIVLGILILLLVILAVLKVGILAEYSTGELTVRAIAGPLRLSLIVPEGEKKNRSKKKVKTPEEAADQAKNTDLGAIKRFLPGIRRALSRVGRNLVVDELTVHYLAAGDDPCDTALAFGKTTAFINGILAGLDNFLRFRKRDIRTAIDFEAEKTTIYVKTAATLRVWQAVGIGVRFLVYYLKNGTSKKSYKTEYGKAEQ